MMLKKCLLFCLAAFLFSITATSQILEPTKWSHEISKINDTEYEIVFKASILESWHLYSQESAGDFGPLPTVFEYKDMDGNYELVGKTSEPDVKPVFDKVFELDIKYFNNAADFKQRIKLINPELSSIEVQVDYMTCDDERCIPSDHLFKISLNGSDTHENTTITIDERSKQLSKQLNINVTGRDKFQDKTESVKNKSYLGIFILGLLGGFLALLTPCVFPMIPLTVTFFTKSSGDSKKGMFNAILYGFFILVIYVLLSLPFHFLDSLNPEILNTISTNIWLNIFFFVILVVFAFSFLGYFELTLPSSWGNKMDSASSRIGGLIGVFLMALTLAIVSFSCTGPILGSLLAGSLTSEGGAMQLTAGMSGFGLALALPFSLFAMFPKWLNSLPKSGGWLNTVKVVLAHLEFAFAIKFLSNADLVAHWGILKREIFIGLWIIIGISLVLYLLGKIKFPHDGPLKKISKVRWSSIVLVLAFVIYLIPGLTNTKYANLKLLSGFPPPLFYSIYDKSNECPLGLNCYKDFNEGLEVAKTENKPIMLDFTGWACVNCRKMEEQVWSKSRIYDLLGENYIIISLYVDDRKRLSEDEQFQYLRPSGTVKSIETIGDKWATFQTINFENNSQPYYVL
ncbi:MAG: cytochrome c biogenesis protein CcdA, partial [Bacteroidota bacterium]